MLELNARGFLHAVQELRAIQAVLGVNVKDQSVTIAEGDRNAVLGHIERLTEALDSIGGRLALKSLGRLQEALEQEVPPAYSTVAYTLADVEARLGDHLDDIKLFVLSEKDAAIFDGDESEDLDIQLNFPSTIFEFSEASKCISLGRDTAAVFHAMRVLEIGIKALSKRLKIPDAAKASERNWGIMLRKINDELDKKWPANIRLPETEGAALERAYATLDAVRNPWRNSTMHVETIYAPHESTHILACVRYFMRTLSAVCDENGEDPI